MHTRQFPLQGSHRLLVVDDHKAAAVFCQQLRAPVCGAADLAADGGILHRAPAAHFQRIVQVLVQGRTNDQPLGRNSAHQVVELALDGFHVLENIGVVVFQVVQDQGVRAVMDKLGALVEERAVVFIGLDDKEVAAAQARGHREILGHAAHQVAGIKPGLVQDPQQHGGGGGFAVGAGHRHHPAMAQDFPGQPLGAGHVIDAPVQNSFHLRVAPGHGITDQHQVRLRLQVLHPVAFH